MGRKLTRDGLLVILSDGGTRLLTFIANAHLANVLGPGPYGTAFLGLTVLSYAMWPADLGLYAHGVRETAKEPEAREFRFGDMLWLRTALGLAGMVVTGLCVFLFMEDERQRSIALLFLLALLPSLWQMDWYYQGRRRYGQLALLRYLFSGIYLAGTWLLVSSGEDLSRIPLIYTAGVILAACAALTMKEREESLRPSFPLFGHQLRKLWKRILQRSTPIGFGSLLTQSVQMVPPIVIALFYDDEQLGLFGAAFRLAMMLLVIDRTFFTLFLPRIANIHASSPERLPEVLRRTFRLVVAVGIGLGLLMIPVAAPAIRFVNGPEFADAAVPLMIMSWFVSATVLTTFFSYALVTAGFENAYFRAALTSAPISLLLILLLTWAFGIVGTAAGVVVAETVMALLMYRRFRRRLGIGLW